MMRKYLYFGAVAGLITIMDQVSKAIVLLKMPEYKSIPILPGFFYLTHVHNPGGAFGFMAQSNSPWRHWLFLAAAVFALGMILYFYHQTPKSYPYMGLALALIFGGAVGNLIDRVRFGEVVDFLDFYLGPVHWPTFNVADSAVTVGVGVFILHLVFKKMPY